ncbi:hypothetical protein AaE_006157, partial [Aphanomyces astaci]
MTGRPYSIVFDGWSNDSTHFLGMFVSLPNVCKGGGEPSMWLLALAPMLDETSFDVATHYEFILETLN